MLHVTRRLLKSVLERHSLRWRGPVSARTVFNRSQAVSPLRKGRLWWLHGLVRLGARGALLAAIPYLPSSGEDKPAKSPGPLPKDSAAGLSHSELVRNAAAVAVDTSCVLLTHCALAAIAAHQEYAKLGYKLTMLLKEHAQYARTPSQEDELWQEIIRHRVELDDQVKQIEESEAMLASAVTVVERTAEAAYQADVELSSLMAGQHTALVRTQVDAARKVSRKAQEELTAVQARGIQATGEGSGPNAQATQR